jgi:hypothetical protein
LLKKLYSKQNKAAAENAIVHVTSYTPPEYRAKTSRKHSLTQFKTPGFHV